MLDSSVTPIALADQPARSEWRDLSATIRHLLRFVLVISLSSAIISCSRPQSIEITIIGANATKNYSGHAAINLTLSKEDARNFLVFTTNVYGRVIEVWAFWQAA